MDNPIGKPKHNPILMALSNVIIFGAAYLVLHLYAKFFIVYGLAILLAILTGTASASLAGINVGGMNILTTISVVLWIAIIIDVFLQTKKINDGKRSLPEGKKVLNILGVLTIILFVVVYIVAQGYGAKKQQQATQYEATKSFLESLDSTPQRTEVKPPTPKRTSDVNSAETTETQPATQEPENRQAIIQAKYPPIQDEKCESFKNDPDSYVSDFFPEHCYFKKAVETNEPRYCNRYTLSQGYSSACLAYLALKNQKPELCSEMATYEPTCSSYYRGGKASILDLCYNPNISQDVKKRCENEFSAFYALIKGNNSPNANEQDATDIMTTKQQNAYTKCEERNGAPRLELSEASGEKEVFCSFAEKGECTQRELNNDECSINRSS
jgi:hypothetical protein